MLSNSLEESSEIVELVPIESKVLFHPRYVCIGLRYVSLMSSYLYISHLQYSSGR
jgi:hypothetical protein